jgi:hypothetical protein
MYDDSEVLPDYRDIWKFSHIIGIFTPNKWPFMYTKNFRNSSTINRSFYILNIFNIIMISMEGNKNRGFTRLSITNKTIDWVRLCHRQGVQATVTVNQGLVSPSDGIICRNTYLESVKCLFVILNLDESLIFTIIMYHLRLKP